MGADPKRHMRSIALTAGVLFVLFVLSGCTIADQAVWPPRNWTQADYGSFSPDVTASFDGKYRAVQTLDRPDGYKVDYILVTIYDSGTNAVVDSFLTERAFDFWGVCWEPDNYDLWIQSADVGTYCMLYEDGCWSRDVDGSSVAYYEDGNKYYEEVTHPRHMPDTMIDRFRMRNGSFEYANSYSPSGQYSAGRSSRWDEALQRSIHGIEICEMEDDRDRSVFFYPLTEGDYCGVCWEREHDDLWVRLNDDIFCLRYEDETWRRDDSAQRPDYIALAYYWDGRIKK